MGLPGAGKTTVALALQEAMPGLVRLSRDDLRRELLRAPVYDDAEKRMLLGAVLERLDAHLRAGRSVVLDGSTFARPAERDAVADVAVRAGARAVFALLEIDTATARRRVADGRDHPAADRRPVLVDEVAARFAPVGPGILRLDGRRPADDLAAAVLAAVERA